MVKYIYCFFMNYFKIILFVKKENVLNLGIINVFLICVIMVKINLCGEKIMCEDLLKLVKLLYMIKYLFNLVWLRFDCWLFWIKIKKVFWLEDLF